MSMRARKALVWIAIVAATALRFGASASAQGEAAETAPAGSSAAPAQTPPVQSEAATPAASGAAASTLEAEKSDAAGEAPATTTNPSPEALRLARERWEIEVMRARARNRATAPSIFAETSGKTTEGRRHRDAGAPFAIGLSFENGWNLDRGYDVFSKNDLAARGGVWLAYDVAALSANAFLALELGWDNEHTSDSSLFGAALKSALDADAFRGGAQLRFVPLAWLQPHARLAAGVTWLRTELTANDVHFKDEGLPPFASFGLGCTFRTPTRFFETQSGDLGSLSVGLMLEGGYLLSAALAVRADGPSGGTRGIDVTDAKLGKLNRSGPYVRGSVVVRF